MHNQNIKQIISNIIDDNTIIHYEYDEDIYIKNTDEISQKIIDMLIEMGYDIPMIRNEAKE